MLGLALRALCFIRISVKTIINILGCFKVNIILDLVSASHTDTSQIEFCQNISNHFNTTFLQYRCLYC